MIYLCVFVKLSQDNDDFNIVRTKILKRFCSVHYSIRFSDQAFRVQLTFVFPPSVLFYDATLKLARNGILCFAWTPVKPMSAVYVDIPQKLHINR